MPQVTNVFIVKNGADPKVLCISVTDTEADPADAPVEVNLNYTDLSTPEKATYDAFEALALTKLP